jgi:hypothetical protein
MQVTELEEIKAALWDQSHHHCIRVTWGMAQVMAVRKSKKGHLQALLRGWERWCPVESVSIECAAPCPTGACDLDDGT